MAINLVYNDSDLTASHDEEKLNIHYIPATINGDGTANVDNYFNNYTTKDENGVLINALRGFPLKGREFKLPEGYSAVVFQEESEKMTEECERSFKFSNAFKEFTYWNYDKNPSDNDPLAKAMDWLELSNMVHEKLTKEDVEIAKSGSKVKKEVKSP